MGIWLTSDLHLGHPLVAEIRGFDSVEEHDKVVIENLKTVPVFSTVYLLGDLAMGDRKGLDTLRSLSTLYEFHVILGNHDKAHPSNNAWAAHQSSFRWAATVSTSGMVRDGKGFKALMCHMPYGDLRFPQWVLPDLGKTLFHGHTHSHEKYSESALGTPQVHVGLDAWDLMPVRLEDAMEVLG